MSRPGVVRIADFVGASDRMFVPTQPRKADPSGRPLRPHISVVIPALNEEEPIADVVRSVARQRVDEIIVVDNGSTDGTWEQAQHAGARVVKEPRQGYWRACRAGVKDVRPETDIVVFLERYGRDSLYVMQRS